MLDRAHLLEGVRAPLFHGKPLTQVQQGGILAILEAWDRLYPEADLRWIAYSLATTHHETGATFKPLREWGRGKGKKYGVPDKATGHIYYGRGFVQLTWKDNYLKMGKRLGLNFVHAPDLVMEPKYAAEILVIGMVEGIFTGRGFKRYIGPVCDYVNARRIINGTDKAALIAGYAKKYEACVRRTYKEDVPVAVQQKPEPKVASAPVAPVARPAELQAPSTPVNAAVTDNPPAMSVTSPTPKVGFWARLKARFA